MSASAELTQSPAMSCSAPLVLSHNVLALDDFYFSYSLSKEADLPEPPPSRPLSIVSRRTVGVSPSKAADKAVKALHFQTHLAAAPALSYLTVQGEGAGCMDILAVEDNLIVLDSCLPTYQSPVYLVYDAVEQSITMIPSNPWLVTPYEPRMKRDTADATGVLLVRPQGGGGDGRSYALVNLVETSIFMDWDSVPAERQDLLYVWRSSSPSPRWDLITAKFPSKFKGGDVANSYTAVLAFTCGGHAFWANLLRGIIYCKVDDILSDHDRGSRKLKFGFIKLPFERPPCRISRQLEFDADMYQTIGRSGQSSIKLVTIHGFVQLLNFVDCAVVVWSLSPKEDITGWTKSFLSLGSLADELEKAGLPTDMVPMYPSLSAEEDDVLYFMLGAYKKCCHAHKRSKTKCKGYIPAAKNPLYHLRVDMRRGVLLASARLDDQASTSLSIASTSVLPSPMIQSGSRTRITTTVTGRRMGKRPRGYGH